MIESIDDDRVRELAAEILQRSEYAAWRPLGDDGSLLTVTASVRAFVDWFLDLPFRQPVLYWTIELGLILVAAILLTHVLWSIRAALNASRVRPETATHAVVPGWIEEAERLHRMGRYLDAARSLQIAVLDVLMRSDRLRLGRSEPNRILRERLHAAPIDVGTRDRLIDLIGRLETAWFRDAAASATLYDDWLTLLRDLRSARQ